MKKEMLTLGILFILQSVCCQAQNLGDWMVSVNAGIEAHDKRLFDYSEKESLLDMQSELWGTYHTGLDIRRKVWQRRRISSFLSLGLAYENDTFTKTFYLGYFGQTRRKLLVTNKYEKILLPLSLLVFYEIGGHWIISGEFASNFLVFRSVDNTSVSNSEFFPLSEGTFELDDIQLRLGVHGRIGNVLIGLYSRVANFQKIDRIIFNRIIQDPRTDQKWEWHNPLRFDLTVGYIW